MCQSASDAPPPARLRELVGWDAPARLVFPDEETAHAVREVLAQALPDHTAFLSGEGHLLVLRVLGAAEVLQRSDDLLLAMRNFRRLTGALARRLSRALHVSLRSLSSRDARLREDIPAAGAVNRIWSYRFWPHQLVFQSTSGLVLASALGYPEEFGVLDAGPFLAFLRGAFDPVEVCGVVRDDPRTVEQFLRGAAVHQQLHVFLRDDWHQVNRSIEVLAAAGLLERVADEEGRPVGWIAPPAQA